MQTLSPQNKAFNVAVFLKKSINVLTFLRNNDDIADEKSLQK
jgi:hypothetical protein